MVMQVDEEMKELNVRNKTLWTGISKHPFFWLDIRNNFSIDVGKWFLRIFINIKNWNFCRYLGIIGK